MSLREFTDDERLHYVGVRGLVTNDDPSHRVDCNCYGFATGVDLEIPDCFEHLVAMGYAPLEVVDPDDDAVALYFKADNPLSQWHLAKRLRGAWPGEVYESKCGSAVAPEVLASIPHLTAEERTKRAMAGLRVVHERDGITGRYGDFCGFWVRREDPEARKRRDAYLGDDYPEVADSSGALPDNICDLLAALPSY
jgi:hypothetical protein